MPLGCTINEDGTFRKEASFSHGTTMLHAAYVTELRVARHAIDIVDLGRRMHEENHTSMPYDEPHTMSSAVMIMNSDRKDINAWVAYDEEEIAVGFMVGAVHRCLFSPTKIAQQELLYVVPESRKSLLANNLIECYEFWAATQKVSQIFLGVAMNDVIHSDRVGLFFERRGYDRVGSYYKKELSR